MADKDNLIDLLQERFASHELPVPQGVWEGIAGQLAMAGTAANGLGELLRDRFAGHEMDVDPSVWGSVSSQLGHAAAPVAASAWSSAMSWLAGGLGLAAVVAGVLYLSHEDPSEIGPVSEQVAQLPVEPAPATTGTDVPGADGQKPDPFVSAILTNASDQKHPAGTSAGSGISSDSASAHTIPAPPAEPTPGSVPADLPQPVRNHGEEIVARLVDQMTQTVDQGPLMAQEPRDPKLLEVAQETHPISITPAEAEEVPGFQLYLPNVFTPNGDGINDAYEPQGVGLERVMIRVYSLLSNELVFEADGVKPWPGNDLRGAPCPSGHYLYAIEVIDAGGRVHTKGQTVLLIR